MKTKSANTIIYLKHNYQVYTVHAYYSYRSQGQNSIAHFFFPPWAFHFDPKTARRHLSHPSYEWKTMNISNPQPEFDHWIPLIKIHSITHEKKGLKQQKLWFYQATNAGLSMKNATW